MSQIEDEINENYKNFFADWTSQAAANSALMHSTNRLVESYRRIACLQAVKTDLVTPNFSSGSAEFFFEAHNDTLVSHINASLGAWRSALQALRSAIENSLSAIYFKDHPIELIQWNAGAFRLTSSELHTYISKHPALAPVPVQLSGVQTIKSEYATLSKAVHASAKNFRMTQEASEVLLWNPDSTKLSMWLAREQKVLEAICLIFICLYRQDLTATKKSSLRAMLYYVIPTTKRADLRREFQISITKP